jgi:hypothetical protein
VSDVVKTCPTCGTTMTWDGSDFVCPNRRCGDEARTGADVWFSFAGSDGREQGDGAITELHRERTAYTTDAVVAIGDPAALEDLAGIPRGALR